MAEREPRPTIRIKRLREEAQLPTYTHEGDAGFDLYSTEEYSLQPRERHAFKLGIASEIPPGWFVSFRDRSGNAGRHGVHVLAGVVDSGYRGEWGVILINLGDKPFSVKEGDRIAQGILQQVGQAKIVETDELKGSARGESGFGSSGKR